MLWLCILLSDCPSSLEGAVTTTPPSFSGCVGVEVAKAGQVLLWVKAAGLETMGSVLVEEATLSGRAVG